MLKSLFSSSFWTSEKEGQSHLVDGGNALSVEDWEVHLRHQQHGHHVGHAEEHKDGSEDVHLKGRDVYFCQLLSVLNQRTFNIWV